MKKELFIHVFEGNGFLSFSSYNDAMEALIDCEVPNYLGTFYLYRDPEIKTHKTAIRCSRENIWKN